MVFPTETYRGPNRSHLKFRDRYGYLNALYYLVVSCRENLESRLRNDLQKPGVAFGVVTHGISRTQFQGVFVHKTDAQKMAEDFSGFISIFQCQTIVSAYRALATYFSEFFLELADAALVKLSDGQVRRLREGFMSTKKLGELYNGIGIPITSTNHEDRQLRALVATRNVIEHNDGLINDEYLRLTDISGLSVGDLAPAGYKEVGEALAIAEWLADSVNKRGLSQWPELTS